MTVRTTIFIFIVLSIPVLAPAATLTVPGMFPTIQDAIDAALPGDIVEVAPGTYMENIDFIGKDITVMSVGGPNVTIIDGGNPLDPQYAKIARLLGMTKANGTEIK